MVNIFAYTPQGSHPPFISVNEHDSYLSVTVRSVDGSQAQLMMPKEQLISMSNNILAHFDAMESDGLW